MIDWDTAVLGPTIDVFGEPVTYTSATGEVLNITGVFDRAFRDLSLLDDSSSASIVTPVLGVRLSQFATPPTKGEQVYVPSVDITYLIREVHPDGHGWQKMLLNRKAP